MKKLDWSQAREPAGKYRPMVRWWWPGMDVKKDVLLSQLEDLKNGFFAGAELQSFLRGALHFDVNDRKSMEKAHGYDTKEYFELVHELMKKAVDEGIFLELTAASGYPLGDVDVDVEKDGMKAMIVGSQYVKGGELQSVNLISAQTAFNKAIGPEKSSSYMSGKMVVWSMDYPRMRRDLKLRRVIIGKGDRPGGEMCISPEAPVYLDEQSMKDVTGFVSDNVLTYPFPEGDWYVFTSFEGPSYQRVKTDSRRDPDKESYVIDHFSSGRVKPYLDRQIGRGHLDEYMGSTFRSFFIDSFELVGPYFWSEAFLTEFKNRRGYDLTPYLPVLMARERDSDQNGHGVSCFDLPNGAGERIRRDYDRTIADVFQDYFMKEVRQWAQAHGVKSRVQCYGHPMDPLKACGTSDIAETEQLASAGLLDFLKIPSSAQLLYGHTLSTAEAFVWPGCDYMEAPFRLLMGSDKLTSASIGQLIYHGMPYIHDDYEWPGYFAWHNSFGSFINRNAPVWEYIVPINKAISRNQYLTQEGERKTNVCLYMGSLKSELPYTGPEFREELSDGEIPGYDRRERYDNIRFDTRCDRWQFVTTQTRRAGLYLTEKGYDYCHINLDSLMKARLDNGELVVGSARFRALILPDVAFIDAEAAKRIQMLKAEGLLVVCIGQRPSEAFSYLDAEKNDALIQKAFSDVTLVPMGGLFDCLMSNGIEPNVDYSGSTGFDAVQRSFENAEVYFVRSHTFEKRMASLRFKQTGKNVYLFDTRSGNVCRIEGQTQNGWTEVKLPFTHFGSVWVVFTNEPVNDTDDTWYHELMCSVNPRSVLPLPNTWKLTLTSVVEGDDKCAVRNEYTLADWSDDEELCLYTGRGVYEAEVELKEEEISDVCLDLGVVADIAKVHINGHLIGEKIVPPYCYCANDAFKAGKNLIRIEVLNSLRNGMMGANRLQTPHVHAVSGLIGPVRLVKNT